ncbi:hypothetical protein BDV93DRAFT_528433 [Ceratobasidium sp. AG-I]|nr:hypothetical protein BDV93DRAFT_528433 [Ceratobasidium sp. AG-I]
MRAGLDRRLKALLEIASGLDNLQELNTELYEIDKKLQATDASSSRNRVMHVQRKQELWSELKVRLDEVVEITSLRLLAQVHRTQTEQISVRPQESKINIIPSYEITHQIEVAEVIWPEYLSSFLIEPGERAKTTLRVGRRGKFSVTYKTILTDSLTAAHDLVEREIQHISQSLHTNVATIVGATEGYNGLNGVVVAMEGIDFKDFASKTHTGVVWAQCMRDFEAVLELGPVWKSLADRITVTPTGHVTIFPSGFLRESFAWIHVGLVDRLCHVSDHAVQSLMRLYAYHRSLLGLEHLALFIGSVHQLRYAFTELDVLNIAASCGLFPPLSAFVFDPASGPMPSFQPQIGEFGRTTYSNGQLVDWEPLGISRHIKNTHLDKRRRYSELDWDDGSAQEINEWLTYTLHNPFPDVDWGNYPADKWFCRKRLREPYDFFWEDIFTEAQEISERLKINLDRIGFCCGVDCTVDLVRPEGATWKDLPTTLYYQWSPNSSDSHKARGFFNVKQDPDAGAWQEELTQKGWCLTFELSLRTYKMGGDWALRCESELKQCIETMPGSYSSAYIDEVIS